MDFVKTLEHDLTERQQKLAALQQTLQQEQQKVELLEKESIRAQTAISLLQSLEQLPKEMMNPETIQNVVQCNISKFKTNLQNIELQQKQVSESKSVVQQQLIQMTSCIQVVQQLIQNLALASN